MAVSKCQYCNRMVRYDARVTPPPKMHRDCLDRKLSTDVLNMLREYEKKR